MHYEREMIPTELDYYEKDGKMIPNWSKNKNRVYPTAEKLKLVLSKIYWKELILEKKID